jgi:hypothetical protein
MSLEQAIRNATSWRPVNRGVDEELKQALPLSTRTYRHRVRNAIGHGGVDFQDDRVIYTDKAGNSEEHSRRSMVRFADRLLDACNAMAIALKVFLLTGGLPRDRWPREILLQELQAAAAAPWWNVSACLPTGCCGRGP